MRRMPCRTFLVGHRSHRVSRLHELPRWGVLAKRCECLFKLPSWHFCDQHRDV